MDDSEQLKILDKKLLEPEYLLSAVIESFLDNESYRGLSFTSLMESVSSSMNVVGINYRAQGQDNGSYLQSNDFQDLLLLVKQLVKNGEVQVLPPEAYNHINRTGFPSVSIQLRILDNDNSPDFTIYPTETVLQGGVNSTDYSSNPYGFRLAMCQPQYDFAYFKLDVLEFYRDDPRYAYEDSGIEGKILVSSDFRDDLGDFYLKRFTYAISDDFRRVVAVFLSDLADQPKADQVRWSLSETRGSFQPHPDFCQRYVVGEWGSSISILTAILYEVYITNEYCRQVGRVPLFATNIDKELSNKPKNFAFITRPTKRAYHDFISVLEKLVCNMNTKFFKGDIQTYEVRYDDNGKSEKKPIGTITLLDNWVKELFKNHDVNRWNYVVTTLRDVRKERQIPAHRIVENEYDDTFNNKQIELLMRVHSSLRIIRIAVGCIPGTDSDQIDEISIVSDFTIYPM